MSCIFTCTDDLDAEFPAVAARRLGLSAVPLLCAREIDVPGSLPRVIRLLLHCYADPDTEARHVYLREAVALRPRPGGTRSEPRHRVQRPHRRHPDLPGGRDLRVRGRAREARLERDAVCAAPAGARGDRGAAAQPQPLSRPGEVGAARSASRSAPACRRAGSRSATAPARSCWRPPTRCSSPAPRSSMPGPRSRSTRTWRRCRAPARSPSRSTRPASTTSRRWHAR